MLKGSGEWKDEERGGAELGRHVGDMGKLGEEGREVPLTRGFDIWISRKSPPLTEKLETSVDKLGQRRSHC